MDAAAWDALRISLEVAATATLLILAPSVWIGYLLARREFVLKPVVETVVALPLVLPPTAVGYVILRLVSVDGPLGERGLGFDPDLLLTWKGAVLAAGVMSVPLVARTARVAFETVPPRLEAMGRSLGLSRARVFASITLPLARRGLLAAAVLGFGRALGEFGATVVVAGNVPGRTQTLALAIFDDIQLGRDQRASQLLVVCTLIAFAVIFTVERLQRRGSA
jgi:molybdate transport system permease protein